MPFSQKTLFRFRPTSRGSFLVPVLTFIVLVILFMVTGCADMQRDEGVRMDNPPTDILLTVTCSDPKAPFTGTLAVDGVVTPVSGVGAGTYHGVGHGLNCTFKKAATDGDIALTASQAGSVLGSTHTDAPFGAVQVKIFRSANLDYTYFNTPK